MRSANDYKKIFTYVAQFIENEAQPGEDIVFTMEAESSYFMRFNNAMVRQAGTVEQVRLNMIFCSNKRTWNHGLMLTGNEHDDTELLAQALNRARAEIVMLPEDPYQVIPDSNETSESVFTGKLIPEADIPRTILEPAKGMDFTGLYSQGTVCEGTMNTKGARHWFATETFLVDYSVWLPNGRGVKSSYAGTQWDDKAYKAKLEESKTIINYLTRDAVTLEPGSYRVFITPDAFTEVITFFSWNGLGEQGFHTGESAYLALKEGRESLSPLFTLTQDFSLGVEPRFNEFGELAPLKLTLIEKGKLANTLVSSRSSKEYGTPSNAAPQGESLRSPVIAGGTLPEADALKALGTGIYVSNFHYLNWSDPQAARITGMTRFACLWVENGTIVGPIKDMRFDESIYNFLGAELEAVTKEQHLIVNSETYEGRSLGGSLIPGFLVKNFKFTL